MTFRRPGQTNLIRGSIGLGPAELNVGNNGSIAAKGAWEYQLYNYYVIFKVTRSYVFLIKTNKLDKNT